MAGVRGNAAFSPRVPNGEGAGSLYSTPEALTLEDSQLSHFFFKRSLSQRVSYSLPRHLCLLKLEPGLLLSPSEQFTINFRKIISMCLCSQNSTHPCAIQGCIAGNPPSLCRCTPAVHRPQKGQHGKWMGCLQVQRSQSRR